MNATMLDAIPLWVVFLATIAIVAGSIEVGYRIGRQRQARLVPEKDQPVGAIAASTLGLLGFMLAFTFGVAASRFDDRRLAVLEESNAIGTAFLRSDFLPEPERSAVRQLFAEYVNVRLAVVKPETHQMAIAQTTVLQEALWKQATVAAAADSHSIMTGLFIESLNEVIDLHSKRVLFGLRSRIPTSVWLALYFIAILAMGALGYQEGLSGSRRSLAVIALLLTFSSVLMLIADLDRPQEGMLRISQQSMVDLMTSIEKHGETP